MTVHCAPLHPPEGHYRGPRPAHPANGRLALHDLAVTRPQESWRWTLPPLSGPVSRVAANHRTLRLDFIPRNGSAGIAVRLGVSMGTVVPHSQENVMLAFRFGDAAPTNCVYSSVPAPSWRLC